MIVELRGPCVGHLNVSSRNSYTIQLTVLGGCEDHPTNGEVLQKDSGGA
jgi:hypothetical protein